MNPADLIAPAPPGFVRSFSGQLVPVSRNPSQPDPARRKLLIVLQHYDGDIERVNDLGLLIGELEKMLNEEADICIFSRFDATKEFSPEVRAVLKTRFRQVHDLRSTRRASGFPYGANEMWHELVNVMSTEQWRNGYYAFLNLEPDCCPTAPGWIGRLIAAWKPVSAAGKLLAGHFRTNPTPHFNGVALYDTDLFRKMRGNVLLGCQSDVAFDVVHARHLNPVGADIPEIFLDYRRATITPDALFATRAGGVTPALFHGVTDGSAIAAVRARHLSANVAAQASNALSVDTRVYCYQGYIPQLDQNEVTAQVNLWKQGWTACGWQPIIITPRDASLHPRYAEFAAKVATIPTVGIPQHAEACWMRWLALDVAGGGLMADCDVLPNGLTPGALPRRAGFNCYDGTIPSLVLADRAGLHWFISEIVGCKLEASDMRGGRPHLSDSSLLARLTGTKQAASGLGFSVHATLNAPERLVSYFGAPSTARAIHFSADAGKSFAPAKRSDCMRAFLKSEAWAMQSDRPAEAPGLAQAFAVASATPTPAKVAANHAIFIRSYHKDIEWLKFCLRSIEKFVTGCDAVVVAVPFAEIELFRSHGIKVVGCDDFQPGYLAQQMTKLHADELFTGNPWITFIDSDCTFTAPTAMGSLFVDGKPVALHFPYDKLVERVPWKSGTEAALGFPVSDEMMRRHAATVKASDLAEFRMWFESNRGQTIDAYVRSRTRTDDFSEFNVLGAWLWTFKHGTRAWFCTEKNEAPALHLRQGWTYGADGIEPYRAELERIVA